MPAARVADPAAGRCRAYLRVDAANRPGTLAGITAALGRHAISIASVRQPDAAEGVVPVVITTHAAAEGDLDRALREIDGLDATSGRAVRLRLFDPPTERENL